MNHRIPARATVNKKRIGHCFALRIIHAITDSVGRKMIKAQFIVYTIAQRIVVAIGSQVHHFFRSSILEAHIPQLICDVPAIINLVKIKIEIISRGTKAALHILIGCEFKYGSTIGTIHIHQHPMRVTGVGGFSKDDQKLIANMQKHGRKHR